MTTYADPLAEIDEQLAQASAPRPTGNKRPVFLFFKPGHKALIRPLATLSQSVVMMKHDKFNADPKLKVAAICAKEEDHDCKYCQDVENDKKLEAKKRFFLPVYVYKVVDETGKTVTYKEKDESGEETEKPVAGVRVLELSGFGVIGDVLKWFREFMKDEDNCSITECDFSISQVGSGQTKTFTVMPKQPRPMADHIKKVIPTQDRVRERVLEAIPPVIGPGERSFEPQLQVVKNASSEEPSENDIPEF